LTIFLLSLKFIDVEGMSCCILSAADGLPVEASPLSFKAGIFFSVTNPSFVISNQSEAVLAAAS